MWINLTAVSKSNLKNLGLRFTEIQSKYFHKQIESIFVVKSRNKKCVGERRIKMGHLTKLQKIISHMINWKMASIMSHMVTTSSLNHMMLSSTNHFGYLNHTFHHDFSQTVHVRKQK